MKSPGRDHQQVCQGVCEGEKEAEGAGPRRGRIGDGLVADNARRRLADAAKRPPGSGRQVAKKPRKHRSGKYSYDAVKVLQKVWAASGGQCGKYLAVSMRTQLDGLERHRELVFGVDRYSAAVREELLSMSAASIDRYLKPAKAIDQIRGVTTTKPSPLLRSSITIRKAGDEVEAEPGFFEGDTVAHCGPTLKGEFARTLNLTDVHTGWVFTRTVRNNAHTHILGALKAGVKEVPFEVTGLDFDNGTEFLYRAVIAWAADMEIFFTRSRPYKKNDKAATPLDRLLAAGVLSPAQAAELVAYRDSLNPAMIAREIADLQIVLLKLAKEKTEQLYLAPLPSALPDIRKGIRVRAS